MRNARMAYYPETPATTEELINVLETDKTAGFKQIKGGVF